jgi:hypothetical protein
MPSSLGVESANGRYLVNQLLDAIDRSWPVGHRWSGAVGCLDWMKRIADKIARQAPGTKAVVGQPELI